MHAPLIFRELAPARILGQWRKISLSYSENANRQMRREIDASDQKNGPENNVRGDRDDTKRQIGNGDRHDGALHQGDHRGERQHGSADHRGHARGNLPSHVVAPAPKFIERIERSRKK
jgi:hypothetical protein